MYINKMIKKELYTWKANWNEMKWRGESSSYKKRKKKLGWSLKGNKEIIDIIGSDVLFIYTIKKII